MNCNEYERYELGEMDAGEFQRHKTECSTCRELEQSDQRLLSAAAALKEDIIEAPELWNRIETSFINEDAPAQGSRLRGLFNRRFHSLLAAAVLMAAVALGIYFGVFLERSGSGLLSDSALERVENTEKAYLKAIDQLEKETAPQMAQMNIELMLLYKDRLATIDEQIRNCREELSLNPANTHIRRYMMAALKDKEKTLTELKRSDLRSEEDNLDIHDMNMQ